MLVPRAVPKALLLVTPFLTHLQGSHLQDPWKPRTPFLPLPQEMGPHLVDEQPKGMQMPQVPPLDLAVEPAPQSSAQPYLDPHFLGMS